MSKFNRQITSKKELIEYFISRFGMTKEEAIKEIESRNLQLEEDDALEKARKERKEFFNR